jgi:hypothetical protein
MLRGKVIAGGILEDSKHANLTAGLEFRFRNYHAIGIDYVFFRNKYEEEAYDSLSGYYQDNGYTFTEKRRYLIIDYRFYFNFFKSATTILPYLNVFTKQGYQTHWYQYRSNFKRIEPLTHESLIQEYGFAIGSHWGTSMSDGRFGFDTSIGIIYNDSKLLFQNTNYSYIIDEFQSDPFRKWKMHIRVNLYYNLFK